MEEQDTIERILRSWETFKQRDGHYLLPFKPTEEENRLIEEAGYDYSIQKGKNGGYVAWIE